MEKYNYFNAVCEDVRAYILDHYSRQELRELMENRGDFEAELRDACWIHDSVTGNASGSYFCNAWKAEESICHNWDLLRDAVDEFCQDFPSDAEVADVTIRCYMLGECIPAVLNELAEELEEEEENI